MKDDDVDRVVDELKNIAWLLVFILAILGIQTIAILISS